MSLCEGSTVRTIVVRVINDLTESNGRITYHYLAALVCQTQLIPIQNGVTFQIALSHVYCWFCLAPAV